MRAPSCRRVRDDLLRSDGETRLRPRVIEEHLSGCAACAGFAARAREVARTLRERGSAPIADGDFAARVVGALPVKSEDVFGWAARRALPAALALALVLGGWCWSATGTPATLFEESPTDDLISWVLQSEELDP